MGGGKESVVVAVKREEVVATAQRRVREVIVVAWSVR